MTDAEDAVRTYLRWRHDPTSVRPDTADLDASIEAEADPLERVKLRSQRARAADVGPSIEADFVAHVASWAREHDVTADALLEEGAERRLLAEAGLLTGPQRSRRPSPSPRGRARVSSADLEAHVRGLPAGTSLTTASLTSEVGGSAATVRKVLETLLGDGTIAEVGKDHSGPGRPRTRYERR